MLLAIDIGNTDIVLGISKFNTIWEHQWRMPTPNSIQMVLPEYERNIRTYFLEAGLHLDDIKGIIISSVVPDVTLPFKQMIQNLFLTEPLLVNHEIYNQLPVKTFNPFEIGSDLMANAMAAYTKFKQTCVVVDFGTALTFTIVQNNGEIAGVTIAPGLKTAIRSLFKHTAQLPEVPLVLPDSVLGKNTVHAIQAGVLLGYVEMVKGMLGRIKSELNTDCKVIATGGLSFLMQPLEGIFDEININLTLNGLQTIHQLITKAS